MCVPLSGTMAMEPQFDAGLNEVATKKKGFNSKGSDVCKNAQSIQNHCYFHLHIQAQKPPLESK